MGRLAWKKEDGHFRRRKMGMEFECSFVVMAMVRKWYFADRCL